MKDDLKKQAHGLKPVVMTGNHGLTAAVHAEIESALETHELIKIRLNAKDRLARKAMIAEVIAKHGAKLIDQIGHVIVIYRPCNTLT